jgi:hypothetical protein
MYSLRNIKVERYKRSREYHSPVLFILLVLIIAALLMIQVVEKRQERQAQIKRLEQQGERLDNQIGALMQSKIKLKMEMLNLYNTILVYYEALRIKDKHFINPPFKKRFKSKSVGPSGPLTLLLSEGE